MQEINEMLNKLDDENNREKQLRKIICDEMIKIKENYKNTELNLSELIPLKSRIEDLELWRAKIHSLLTTQTPTGKEKLTRAGAMLSLLQKK